MTRSESGNVGVDFAFPETKIGRRGLLKNPKAIEAPLASLDSNLVSLLPKAAMAQGTAGGRFAVAEEQKIGDLKTDPVMKKPKKSRLGHVFPYICYNLYCIAYT